MRNMYYVDMHCHTAPKPYSWSLKKDKRRWDCRNVRKSIWFNDPPKVFDKFINKQIGLTRFSQSDLRTQSKGEVRIFSASISPIERGFVIPKFWPQNLAFDLSNFIDCVLPRILRGILIKVFACLIIKVVAGFSWIYIFKIRRKKRDYFADLCEEYKFYICEQRKQENANYPINFMLTRKFEDIITEVKGADKDLIYIFFSFEGCHVFNNGGLKSSLKDMKRGGVSEKSKNGVKEKIDIVKKWAYPPFFVSIAHHMNNDLCGHAKSLSGPLERILDQETGMDSGFTDIGNYVVEQLLSEENGNRILIDIKHMSVKSRFEYYHKLTTDKDYIGKRIPVFASHGAVIGDKSLKTRIDNESSDWVKEIYSDWVKEIIIGPANIDFNDWVEKKFSNWTDMTFSVRAKMKFSNWVEENFYDWVKENFREWIVIDFCVRFEKNFSEWLEEKFDPSVEAIFSAWVKENFRNWVIKRYGEEALKDSTNDDNSEPGQGDEKNLSNLSNNPPSIGYTVSSSNKRNLHSNNLYIDVYHTENELHFNGADVNFFDEEICIIEQTGGFLGIQIDERILCSTEEKEFNKKIKNRGEQLHHQAGLVWKQIRYIAKVLDRNGKDGWKTAAIGSDYDGLVDPPNGYWSSEDFRILEENLVHHAYVYFRYHSHELKEEINRHPAGEQDLAVPIPKPNPKSLAKEVAKALGQTGVRDQARDLSMAMAEIKKYLNKQPRDKPQDFTHDENNTKGGALKKILAKVFAVVIYLVRFLGLAFIPTLVIAVFKALCIDLGPPKEKERLSSVKNFEVAKENAMIVIDLFMRGNAIRFLHDYYKDNRTIVKDNREAVECP